MSAENNDYFAPTVSEHTLDPGGNYVSPTSDLSSSSGPGVLNTSGEG